MIPSNGEACQMCGHTAPRLVPTEVPVQIGEHLFCRECDAEHVVEPDGLRLVTVPDGPQG